MKIIIITKRFYILERQNNFPESHAIDGQNKETAGISIPLRKFMRYEVAKGD